MSYDLTRIEGAVREIEWEMRGKDPDERAALMDALCERTMSWPAQHAEEVARLRAERDEAEASVKALRAQNNHLAEKSADMIATLRGEVDALKASLEQADGAIAVHVADWSSVCAAAGYPNGVATSAESLCAQLTRLQSEHSAAVELNRAYSRRLRTGIAENVRLLGVLERIEGGDQPCRDESVLRQWAYEGRVLNRDAAALSGGTA